LTREQRKSAIEKPGAGSGCTGGTAPVNRLLNDMGARPQPAPLMQHVLMRLWIERRRPIGGGAEPEGGAVELKLEDYKAMAASSRA
jgi:hypothetical protein